ncbi:MAG TPA: DNA mismatch repair endonuclease MutL, partial [Myxococcota bacterium]|nr:DNA mismatch repair endonuclease MutL [Myxococcota bacterium]
MTAGGAPCYARAQGGQDIPERAVPARVQRLPSALIDQIAAGEVVERPASVAKELIENALDAGASRVRVELRDGGRALCAVTDDGTGMSPEDARLALERHATSKLGQLEDLARIASFGFRGEALPAIAAVSSLRLRTRTAADETGFELWVEAGVRRGERAVGAPVGTRIEVSDLFGNVPARRKFLKSGATEWGHAAEWIARTALAQPAVHFDVMREGRLAWSWPAVSDPLDRVAAVLGEREAEALLAVDASEGRVRTHGWVSRPDRHRSNLSGVYLFVNGRPVRDRVLQHALVDCYRDVLPRGRFPSAVLFVDLPLEAVDVNVHPAKWEVRFADARAAHGWIGEAVRSGLAGRRWLAGAPAAPEPPAPRAPDRRREFEPVPPRPEHADPAATDWLFAQTDGIGAVPPVENARVRFGELRLLGQLLATYLLVEGKQDLLLVDQHAAHERVLYEQLRAAWLAHGVERQALLAPLAVQFEPRALAVLAERAEDAARLGFEIEPFGDDTLAVRTVPALLAGRDPAGLVRGLADAWLQAPEGPRAPQVSRSEVKASEDHRA